MPNHVSTILRSVPEVIHALLNESGVDFNRIIPMPEEVIQGSVGHAEIDGVHQKVYWECTEEDPLGLKSEPIPYPDDAIDWYEWSISNWGTKWNAYDTAVSDRFTVVRFDTAWAHPWPVIVKLSSMFPNARIEVVYADEDLGSNLGAYVIQNREIRSVPITEGTPEAADLASLIKYGMHYEDLDTFTEEVAPGLSVVDIPSEAKQSLTMLEVLTTALGSKGGQ